MIWTESGTAGNAVNFRDVIRHDHLCAAEAFWVLDDRDDPESPAISSEEKVVHAKAITDAKQDELERHQPREASGAQGGTEWEPQSEKNVANSKRTVGPCDWEKRVE